MCYPTLPKVPTKRLSNNIQIGYMKGSSLKQTDIHPARVVTMYSHHPNRSQTTVCITLGTVAWKNFFLSSRVNALDSLQPKPWHHSPDSLHIHATKHSLYLAPLFCSPPFFFFFIFLLLVCLLAARSPNCNVRGTFVRSLRSKEPPRHPRPLHSA